MPNVTVVRRLQFNAAHRVHNPALSDAENKALFGKCNNPNWHGHNYTLDVSVTGPVDDRTGYVIDLADVKRIVSREVVDKVDHRNLNLEVDFLRGVIPTTENFVVAMWRVLEPAARPARVAAAVAACPAGAGYRGALLARGAGALEAAASRAGNGSFAVACDLTDDAQVEAAVHRVLDALGEAPGVLVNSAGAFTLARVDAT